MVRTTLVAVLACCVLGGLFPAHAQDSSRGVADSTEPWYEGAWTHIVTRNGVQFGYLFYDKADTQNNGVVIRLRNERDVAVRYRFTIIFRGPEGEATAQAEGRLGPGEMKTGEPDGLFWIPFTDGRRVGEVGLRGIDVTPLSRNQTLRPSGG
ncbi:hypothetical protein [Salinibacter sp. 10B]|uniref:hypothetical protein n=1 Tax=Salinibacter sp. 10B TaxID=1923971 RepID=UPI000CF483CE|nr:hypothetical protein [Salinibacter sp. 10B]